MQRMLCFDDVLIVPQYSEIESRAQVDLSVYDPEDHSKRYSLAPGLRGLTCPIVGAPMDTVVGAEAARVLDTNGGFSVLHRYTSPNDQCTELYKVSLYDEDETSNVACAVGTTGDYMSRASDLYVCGCRAFCIDVAHGHHVNVRRAVSALRDRYGDSVHIMAGNVATLEAFNDLADWGCDSIRVGVGGGSVCTTRIQTGHGVPTFQSVLDCSKSDRRALIIADGGIRNSGDAVKALAAGADLLMLGSVLAGHDESPGDTVVNKAGRYKAFRGMASRSAQEDWFGHVGGVEGVSTMIKCKGPLQTTLDSFLAGMRSGLSYSGADKIYKLRAAAKFVTVTSNAVSENRPHVFSQI